MAAMAYIQAPSVFDLEQIQELIVILKISMLINILNA